MDVVHAFDAASGDSIRLAADVRYAVREDGGLTILDVAGGGEIHVEGADVASAVVGGTLVPDAGDGVRNLFQGGDGDDTLIGGPYAGNPGGRLSGRRRR